MLNNKIAVITDGSCDAGIAISKKLLESGAAVILNNAPGVPPAGGYPGLLTAVSYDLTKFDGGEMLASFVREKFGRADILIHSDNHVCEASIEYMPEADFMRALEVNAKTAFVATRAFGAMMAEAGSGIILYISSIHDEKATGCAFSYSMAKGAVLMLMREAALEYGPHGVKINLIETGGVAGDDTLFSGADLSNLYTDMNERMATGSPVTHEDLADYIAHYVSAPNPSLNGANIRLDGGFTLYYIGRQK